MLIPAWLFAILSVFMLIIAAFGLVRLPDSLTRQHAATKAATLSVSLLVVGLMWFSVSSGWEWGWIVRLLLLLFLLLLTLPIASHALAHSAVCEQPEQFLERDETKHNR